MMEEGFISWKEKVWTSVANRIGPAEQQLGYAPVSMVQSSTARTVACGSTINSREKHT